MKKKITNKITYGITNKEQTNNKQITTNKNEKNDKNEKKIRNIVGVYEQNIGILSPASAELILSYLDDFKDENIIIQAIKIASQKNKKSASYINGILRDWKNKGYKVLADIQQENKKNIESDTERRVKEALYG